MAEKRGWTVYLVPGSHFDLGWCASPSETLLYGADIIKHAVDAITGEFPDYRFTVEYAVFLAHFLLHHPEYLDKVRKLVAEGKLEVCATWTGMMTQARPLGAPPGVPPVLSGTPARLGIGSETPSFV